MPMRITFCLPQFAEHNLRLQPWLTVYRIVLGLISRGHRIDVITDGAQANNMAGIHIHTVPSLRATSSKHIIHLLEAISPDCVVVSITPLSLATASWYKILKKYHSIAFLSYAFYHAKHIINAFPYLNNRERWEYGRHLLVPRYLWVNRLTNMFNGVICQSRRTKCVMEDSAGSDIPVYNIPPGIDLDMWPTIEDRKSNNNDTELLYVGKASAIRGFPIVLDAISRVSGPHIRLKVLARGADERALSNIKTEIDRRNIQDRVDVQGGWLILDELRRELQSATAVLLPFVLVPSELPVSVMEAIACGTPVIVSDIDGLPEAAGDAGLVVPSGKADTLASAIEKIDRDRDLLESLRSACLKIRKDMPSWDAQSRCWEEILTN